MQKPSFDPGLTNKYAGELKRIITPEGRFNVRRSGTTWRDFHPYLILINIPFAWFMLIVIAAFIVVNLFFAGIYMAIGIENLKGAEAPTPGLRFLNAFFFSAHTLTTVGYGSISPSGPAANAIASFEALMGLLAFAIATGLLFGRFSRPSARIGFSRNMVVAPYLDGTSLQFRVVNRRSNTLIELSATLLLMTVESTNGRIQRRYTLLELERTQVLFFALPWTIVHPIDEKSPLYGKTAEDLAQLQAEVLIVMKGFDDTFSQTVHARYSYRYDEIVWGAKFASTFDVDPDGELRVWMNRVGTLEPAPLPAATRALP
ncbi:MAG TPA: ion channel [Bryobacteraceae bacterium]|nr:ion channel [Bryobacteraceae bacterium]